MLLNIAFGARSRESLRKDLGHWRSHPSWPTASPPLLTQGKGKVEVWHMRMVGERGSTQKGYWDLRGKGEKEQMVKQRTRE